MRDNKQPMNRRVFLNRAMTGLTAIAFHRLIAACSPPLEDVATLSSNVPSPTQAPFSSNSPTAGVATSPTAFQAQADDQNQTEQQVNEPGTETVGETTAPPAQEIPYLVVARNGEPEDMVRAALAALGGMERFVYAGANVLIKPNICVSYHTYEYAATTNPWVVGALVKLCNEAGARKVSVMDYPFGGSSDQAYAASGIAEQVNAAGGEMIAVTDFKFRQQKINGIRLNKASVFDDVMNADVLINVPIAKNHGLAKLTLGMKNLMGTVWQRSILHSGLGQNLADLANFLKPSLTVIDAVRMLMRNGPTGGSLDDVQKLDTIIASPDIVAADSYAATLFGMRPLDLEYVQAGTDMGLGRSDLENLKIEELTVGV